MEQNITAVNRNILDMSEINLNNISSSVTLLCRYFQQYLNCCTMFVTSTDIFTLKHPYDHMLYFLKPD